MTVTCIITCKNDDTTTKWQITFINLFPNSCHYSARRAKYWKYFTMHFDTVHAFGYNSAGSEPICMKSGALWEHCLLLALAAFGRDPRRSESQAKFVFFCQVNNARLYRFPVSRPNFTKFIHKTWIGVAMNPFRTEFWNFPRKRSFSNYPNFSPKSSTTCDFKPL